MKFMQKSLLPLAAVGVLVVGTAFADPLLRTNPEAAGFSRERLGRIGPAKAAPQGACRIRKRI